MPRPAPLTALLLALSLTACAPLVTQSPGQGLSPVNAVADGEVKHLMLAGHDVVSYFTEGTHRKGEPGWRSDYKGVTFYFSKASHKALFDAGPEKYLPQYGGYCANGIVYGIPWGGNADTWRIIDGRLFIFGGAGSRDGFMVDPVRHVALADRFWKEEVEGSNALVQRSRRLLFKVPHYKSGEDVAAEVARARAAGTLK